MQTPISRLGIASLVVLAATAVLPAVASAPSSGASSTVVYMGGNDVVIKAADGKILNYMVPTGKEFSVGGKSMPVSSLKPGMKLSGMVSVGTDPQVVSSVTVLQGKVYATTPPDSITLQLPDGAKEFAVPTGTMFMVAGTPKPLTAVKPDMVLDVTIITPAETGADMSVPPQTPPMSGALLVAKNDELPAAGTNLPLYGVLGFALMLFGFAVLRFRKPAFQA